MSHSNHSKAAVKAVTSSDLLDDAKALAEKITALLGPAPALTRAAVQGSAKLRKGGEPMIRKIASLSNKLGLVVPSYPTATLVQKLDQATSLEDLHDALTTATKHVGDAIFQAESQSWAGATAHYTMLRRLAQKDGDVKKSLQPVIQFFASRSATVEQAAKESRGGAHRGTAEATANRAAKRAADAKILAASENQVSTVSDAPTAAIPTVTTTASNGASPSPQVAAVAPSNGTGH